MESIDELKEVDIKDCTCYYFDDIMRVGHFDFNNVLLGKKSYKKSYENTLIYVISYKNFRGAKPFCISFDKVDGFIKVCNGTIILAKTYETNFSVVVK